MTPIANWSLTWLSILALVIQLPSTSSSGLTDLLPADVVVKKIPEEHLMGPYTIYRKPLTWEDAETYCESKTGHLASFLTSREATLLTDKLYDFSEKPSSEYIKGQVKSEFGLDRRYWIGLNDLYRGEGNWTWVVGIDAKDKKLEPLTYRSMWFPGQPDHVDSNGKSHGRPEHCGALWNPTFHKDKHHTFADHECHNKYYFICQINTRGGENKTGVGSSFELPKHRSSHSHKKQKNRDEDERQRQNSRTITTIESPPRHTSVSNPLFPDIDALKNHPGFSELFEESESDEFIQIHPTSTTKIRGTTTTTTKTTTTTTTTTMKPTTSKFIARVRKMKKTAVPITDQPYNALITSREAESEIPDSDLTLKYDTTDFHIQDTRAVKDTEVSDDNTDGTRNVEKSLRNDDKNSLIEELYASENINNALPNLSCDKHKTDNGTKKLTPAKNTSNGSTLPNNPNENGKTESTKAKYEEEKSENTDAKSRKIKYPENDETGINVNETTKSFKIENVTNTPKFSPRSASEKIIKTVNETSRSNNAEHAQGVTEKNQRDNHAGAEIIESRYTNDQNLTETLNAAIRNIILDVNVAIAGITDHIKAALKNVTDHIYFSSNSNNKTNPIKNKSLSAPSHDLKPRKASIPNSTRREIPIDTPRISDNSKTSNKNGSSTTVKPSRSADTKAERKVTGTSSIARNNVYIRRDNSRIGKVDITYIKDDNECNNNTKTICEATNVKDKSERGGELEQPENRKINPSDDRLVKEKSVQRKNLGSKVLQHSNASTMSGKSETPFVKNAGEMKAPLPDKAVATPVAGTPDSERSINKDKEQRSLRPNGSNKKSNIELARNQDQIQSSRGPSEEAEAIDESKNDTASDEYITLINPESAETISDSTADIKDLKVPKEIQNQDGTKRVKQGKSIIQAEDPVDTEEDDQFLL